MTGNAYRLSKNYEKAKEAFEKASKGQEMLSSYAFLFEYCTDAIANIYFNHFFTFNN